MPAAILVSLYFFSETAALLIMSLYSKYSAQAQLYQHLHTCTKLWHYHYTNGESVTILLAQLLRALQGVRKAAT